MRKIFTTLQTFILAISFFVHAQVFSQSSRIIIAPCLLPDLIIDNVTIQSANQHNVTFDFTVKNAGFGTLYLDRMYFQIYLSKDAIYDNLDIPGGGSIFSSNPLVLSSGQTYKANWNSYNAADLTQYKYIIIQVKEINTGSVPECNTANNTTSAYFGCVLSDLVVDNIDIANVVGNSVNFNFTLRNTGWAPLPLSKMYFQAYVSKDAVYDPTDQPAGGSIFYPNLPNLLKDQTYTGSWTSNPFVSITEYPYVIIKFEVQQGNVVPECNTSDNVGVKYIGCNLAELTVTNLAINSVVGNNVNFSYTLKNSGWAPLPLSKMYFQAYVSKDGVYDPTDQPAGGSIFYPNVPDLLKDQTYTGTWSSNPFVSITEYPYVIIKFDVQQGNVVPECNTSDNVGVKYIGCNLAELTVTSLVINSVIGNNVTYSYTIKNTGWNPLDLSNVYLHSYVSLTSTSGFFSLTAGEGILGTNVVLLKDQEYTGSWTSTSSGGFSFFKYLIVNFGARPGSVISECNYNNNSVYRLINGSNFSAINPDLNSSSLFKVAMNQNNKTVSISDESTGLPIVFHIYSVDARFNGQSLINGTVTGNKEIDLSSLKPGFYIIHVSNGGESYSEKFMILE